MRPQVVERADTPPEATTGRSVRGADARAAGRGWARVSVPSLVDVGDDVAGAALARPAGRASRRARRPPGSSRARPAWCRARRGRRRSGRRARRSPARTSPGSSSAAVPRLTRRAAGGQRRGQRLVVADAAGQLDVDVELADDLGEQLAVARRGRTRRRGRRGAPTRRRRAARRGRPSSGSPYDVSLPASPCTRRTAWPSATSTAGSSTRRSVVVLVTGGTSGRG